jgi:hypothetical protein
VRNIRLRTKFLFALLAVSVGLTTATLLAVRLRVQDKVRESLGQDLRTSARTYEKFEAQRTESLLRSAQLIANLPNVRALMTTRDLATIQDASTGILKLSGADMIMLADRTGKVSAWQPEKLHSNGPQVQAMLLRSLERGEPRDWWFTGGHLYEVLMQPIEFGALPHNTTIGFLVVGHDVGTQLRKHSGKLRRVKWSSGVARPSSRAAWTRDGSVSFLKRLPEIRYIPVICRKKSNSARSAIWSAQ